MSNTILPNSVNKAIPFALLHIAAENSNLFARCKANDSGSKFSRVSNITERQGAGIVCCSDQVAPMTVADVSAVESAERHRSDYIIAEKTPVACQDLHFCERFLLNIANASMQTRFYCLYRLLKPKFRCTCRCIRNPRCFCRYGHACHH